MHRTTLATATAVVAPLLLVGCLGRPNPRIAGIIRDAADANDADTDISFSYDDQGRVEEVERVEGDEKRTWTFTWEGATLSSVVVETEIGGTRAETETTLEYDNGRLVEATSESGNDRQKSSFEYDDQGRLVEAVSDSGDVESTTTLAYDDDGPLERFENESVIGGGKVTSSIELTRKNGQLSSINLARESGDQEFELEYDEETGQLAEMVFDTTADLNGTRTVVTGTIAYSYDDEGRVETMEQTASVDSVEADVATIDLKYDDGEASSLDMAPNEVFLFGVLFDLKGGSHGTLHNTTTVPRLAFPSW